ncbi:MAG TPA: ABC transporter permease [Nitrospiria bacterium]|nr:ABC transporter permease [Nitrospiria bacterium]
MRGFKKNWLVLAAGLLIIIITIGAIFAPLLAPYPFDLQDPERILSPPDMGHIMGTDRLGRDLLSRLIYGSRVSLSIGFFTALSALIIGTFYGAVSGYAGGRLDNIMMRGVDVVYALPDLLLIILITIIIGRGVTGIFLALSIMSWMTIARLIRGEVLRIKEMPYIEAERAIGAGDGRILLYHILPNTLGPLIVTLTFRIPAAILAESTLSFIGLGISPPFASWGTLANDGWTTLRFYPHLIVFPGITIFLTILSFNFIGDWIGDRLDPQRRERRAA